jgi:hypothetical protein
MPDTAVVFEHVTVLRQTDFGFWCQIEQSQVFVRSAVPQPGTTVRITGDVGRLMLPKRFVPQQGLPLSKPIGTDALGAIDSDGAWHRAPWLDEDPGLGDRGGGEREPRETQIADPAIPAPCIDAGGGEPISHQHIVVGGRIDLDRDLIGRGSEGQHGVADEAHSSAGMSIRGRSRSPRWRWEIAEYQTALRLGLPQAEGGLNQAIEAERRASQGR